MFQARDLDAQISILGILLRQVSYNRVQVRLGLFKPYARFQPRKDSEIVAVSCFQLGGRSVRNPYLGCARIREAERRWHYTDHGVWLRIDRNCFSNQARISPETPLPQPVAQESDAIASGLIFFRKKRAA